MTRDPSFQIDAGSKCLLMSCSCTYHPCRKQLWALALQPHACACSPDQNLGKTLDKTQAASFAEAHPLRSLHGSTFRILAQPTTVIDLLNFSTQRSWQILLDMKFVQFCHSDHFPPLRGVGQKCKWHFSESKTRVLRQQKTTVQIPENTTIIELFFWIRLVFPWGRILTGAMQSSESSQRDRDGGSGLEKSQWLQSWSML